jgi:hypothetical protein
MNTTANLEKIFLDINNGWSGKALKVAARSARWIWRGFSNVLFLCAAPFLLLASAFVACPAQNLIRDGK